MPLSKITLTENIRDKMSALTTFSERATLKGVEIAKVDAIGAYEKGDIVLDIQSIEPIEKGVQVFLRAWKGGEQLGFGEDGSVDIERFRIFNPPVLVNDPLGDIIIPSTIDEISKLVIPERRLREDPKEALYQSLLHTVGVVGKTGTKIQQGKIGNTTSTFYSGAGDGSVSTANATWATARGAASGTPVYNEATRYMMADLDAGTYTIARAYFPFDTSAIPDTDDISSATFSVDNSGAQSGACLAGLIQTTTADTATLTGTDFAALTLNSPTEGCASRVALTTTGYKDFAMNASGIGWISKTGFTKLGLRLSNDIDNSAPVARNYVLLYHSEQTGTASDPKLVVVHAASSVSVTVSAGVNAGTFSIPTYTPKINVALARATLTALFSIPTYAVLSGSALFVASVVSATFSIPTYVAKASANAYASTLSATFSVITYAIGLGTRIMQATLSATFTTVVLSKAGSVWTKVARNSTGLWTRSNRNND